LEWALALVALALLGVAAVSGRLSGTPITPRSCSSPSGRWSVPMGAVAAATVFGELTVEEALSLAVVPAPTDAALGQAVITEPRVPQRIRQALNVASGLNDGICVPLLFAAVAVADVDSEISGGRRRPLGPRHGLTAAPLADSYARWYEQHPRAKAPPMESVPAEVTRLRGPTGRPT
jgi:hypothetical protein